MATKKEPQRVSRGLLRLISVAIAFIIWITVYNLSDNLISESRNVELKVMNEGDLSSSNYTYDLDSTTVQVGYTIRSNERDKVSSNDFNVYVDLSEYSITNAVPVHYEVLNNKDRYLSNLRVEPSVIKVNAEQMQTKQFELQVITKGKVDSSYDVKSIDTSANVIIVTGPRSEIGRINKVGIEIDIDGIDDDIDGSAIVNLYDSNENVLKVSDKVSSNIRSISYNVALYIHKNIPVRMNVIGEPGENAYHTSSSLSVDSAEIYGDKEQVSAISEISLGDIDITGMTANYKQHIDLNTYLPSGVNVYGDSGCDIDIKIVQIIPETQPTAKDETVENTDESSEVESTEDESSVSPLGPAGPSEVESSEESSQETSEEVEETTGYVRIGKR